MKLPHRIKVRSNKGIADGQGGQTEEYEYITEDYIRARVESISARRRFYAQAIQSMSTHKVTVRFNDDIKQQMQIEYMGRIFTIWDIVLIHSGSGKPQFMACECEEIS